MDHTVARTGIGGLAAPIKAKLAMIAGAEASLIRLCRRGDDEAWQRLVGNYQGVVYQVSYRLLGNRDDAFEAGQARFDIDARVAEMAGANGGGPPVKLRAGEGEIRISSP